MSDARTRAANAGRAVLKVAGIGAKELGKTLMAGISPVRSEQAQSRRLSVPARQVQSRQPRQQPVKSFFQQKKVDIPQLRIPKSLVDKKRNVIANPFGPDVSERLGIPHRDTITMREYELIKRDMMRASVR